MIMFPSENKTQKMRNSGILKKNKENTIKDRTILLHRRKGERESQIKNVSIHIAGNERKL